MTSKTLSNQRTKSWEQRIADDLRVLEDRHLLRCLRVVEDGDGVRIRLDGREVVNCSSNDYLGLSHHPVVAGAVRQVVDRLGWGAGASRLISGSTSLHHELEEAIARFKGTEAAIIYGSGYLANLGVVTALVGHGDVVYSDRLNHASLVDAAVLSRARHRRYRHGDIAHVRELVASETVSGKRLLVTETVFSMDGDVAPLRELVTACQSRDVMVMVDEAHGTGVCGERGAGVVEQLGLGADDVDVQMGTLSKALGGIGAYVAGSRALIDYLVNASRSFIYTTALPAAAAAASLAALKLVQQEPERRQRLWANAQFLHGALHREGFDIGRTETPIIPILIGDPERTMQLSQLLLEAGFYLQGIRPPTVPRGQSRLRLTVTSEHSRSDLERLMETLVRLRKQFGVEVREA